MSRSTLFILTVVFGLTLALVGFFLSAPIGAPSGPSISDPRVEFAPLMFVVGVILLFGSAIVYELVPGTEEENHKDEVAADLPDERA